VHKLFVLLSCSLIACGGNGSHSGPDAPGGGDGGLPPDGPVMPVLPGADPSFGNGGLVTLGYPGGIAAIMRVARQADGKIVGVGGSEESLLIMRANADGSFDSGFGKGGVVQMPWGVATNGVTVGYGCAIQSDGKIVAAARVLGSYRGLIPVAVVVRLQTDGTPDPTFAQNGVWVGPVASAAQSVAIDASGNLVVGGGGALYRLSPTGTLDTTFGTNGRAGASVAATDMALQSDGKIVAIGGTLIERFTATGAVDTSFATNGIYQVPSARSYDQLFTVQILTGDKILAAGALTPTTSGANQDYWIGRFTSAGVPDTTFGTAGAIAGTGMGGVAYGADVDPSGNVVGSGYFSIGGGMGRSARFSSAGVLDTTFGAGGLGPSNATSIPFTNLAFEPGGTFTVGGAVVDTSVFAYEPAFFRVTAAGAADATFATGGSAHQSVSGSFDRAQAVAFQSDGKLLIGGWSFPSNGAMVSRLNHDGSIDTSFGMSGSLPRQGQLQYVNAIAVQPDGKILVSGYSSSGQQLVVERYTTGGMPDMAFGTMGVAGGPVFAGKSAYGLNMTVAPDGSIVLVGQTQSGTGTGTEYAIMELTADGAAKPGFGTAGAASSAFGGSGAIATHAVAQANGGVVVLGQSSAPTLVRFAPDGTLDTTFGTVVLPTGTGSMVPFGLTLQPDQSILVVAGNYQTGDMEVVRYLPTGAIDATFGTNGVAKQTFAPNDYYGLYSFYGLALLPGGKIQVGFALASADGLTESGVMLRLNSDGTPDASYGTAGVTSVAIGRGSTSINAMGVDPDGKLVVVGRTWTETGGSDFMALRFIL
jgi:uncharacterized delta-60 repeat protein